MSSTWRSTIGRISLLAALVGVVATTGCGDDTGGGGGSGGASAGTDSTASTGSGTAGSGGAGGGAGLECPGTVIGTWERDGVAKESSTSVGTFLVGVWGFNLVACDGSDDVVQFKFLTAPVEPATFDLANKLPPANDEPGAIYLDGETGGGFYTDPDHGGQLVITEVDPDAMTFSGTFAFTAAGGDYEGPNGETVTVTNGVLIDVPFSIAEE